MVRISCLSASPTGVTQEATLLPLSSTVQARHWPSPQPYLVPVSFRSSRRTSSKGRCGSVVTVRGCPLTVKAMVESIRQVRSVSAKYAWSLEDRVPATPFQSSFLTAESTENTRNSRLVYFFFALSAFLAAKVENETGPSTRCLPGPCGAEPARLLLLQTRMPNGNMARPTTPGSSRSPFGCKTRATRRNTARLALTLTWGFGRGRRKASLRP